MLPVQAMAETAMTASEAESMVNQMKTILDQYATKIRVLELENAVLREEIRKAGIQIPLSAFSGIVVNPTTTSASQSNTITTPSTTMLTGTGVATIASSGVTLTGT